MRLCPCEKRKKKREKRKKEEEPFSFSSFLLSSFFFLISSFVKVNPALHMEDWATAADRALGARRISLRAGG